MKVLADVHIAKKIVKFFERKGIEAIHVNDILDGFYTKDSAIRAYADEHNFILISKDSDFKDSHFVLNSPKKLIKISLGNIPTAKLVEILDQQFLLISEKCESTKFFMEISADRIWIIE